MSGPVPIPAGIDFNVIAEVAGGFDLERDCFVAVSEVPDVPTVEEKVLYVDGHRTRYRKGNVLLAGPCAPTDGIWRLSECLASMLGVRP